MNTWVKFGQIWCVKSESSKRGETVTVTTKAGKTSEVRLGREFRPGVFEVAPKIPQTMSEAFVEGGTYDYHKMWFEVDGEKFYHRGCCKQIWEGPTKSGEFTVDFVCSVLADTFFVCLKDKDGRFLKDPHYCGFKEFAVAVKYVRHYWANN